MSRTTQYIGLNAEATKLVSSLRLIDNPMNQTFGIFGEEVPLKTWEDDEGNIFREMEQCAPWSSGPMIFTQIVKNETEILHRWKGKTEEYGPGPGPEFDSERGIIFIVSEDELA